MNVKQKKKIEMTISWSWACCNLLVRRPRVLIFFTLQFTIQMEKNTISTISFHIYILSRFRTLYNGAVRQ
jgi:hypothetical protein